MLIAVNVYTERVEGEVLVWLVISQQDGQVYAFSFPPEDAQALHVALGEAVHKATLLAPTDGRGPT